MGQHLEIVRTIIAYYPLRVVGYIIVSVGIWGDIWRYHNRTYVELKQSQQEVTPDNFQPSCRTHNEIEKKEIFIIYIIIRALKDIQNTKWW